MKYTWYVMACSFIGSVLLGLMADQALAMRPDYEALNAAFLELSGLSARATLMITSAVFINAAVFYILYKATTAYMGKKTRYFHAAFLECMGELARMKGKEQGYDARIVDEFIIYQSAEKAQAPIGLSGGRRRAPV